MGHKNLLVTHTLYRLKGYSEAHAVASAAPAASFKSPFRTSGPWLNCCQQSNALTDEEA